MKERDSSETNLNSLKETSRIAGLSKRRALNNSPFFKAAPMLSLTSSTFSLLNPSPRSLYICLQGDEQRSDNQRDRDNELEPYK